MLCFFKKLISCSCGGAYSSQNTQKLQPAEEIKSVKVLGSGCKNCHMLKENTDAALKELGLNICCCGYDNIQYNYKKKNSCIFNCYCHNFIRVVSWAGLRCKY